MIKKILSRSLLFFLCVLVLLGFTYGGFWIYLGYHKSKLVEQINKEGGLVAKVVDASKYSVADFIRYLCFDGECYLYLLVNPHSELYHLEEIEKKRPKGTHLFFFCYGYSFENSRLEMNLELDKSKIELTEEEDLLTGIRRYSYPSLYKIREQRLKGWFER